MWKKLKYLIIKLLIPLVALYLRIISRTIRWEKYYDFDKSAGEIYAIWHGNALCMALMGIDRNIYTLVSRFRDGDIAAYLLQKLGYYVVRGSTEEGRVEKGGRSGFLKLLKALREGYKVAITVDGPKGPAFVVKKGIVLLAKKSGKPIIPIYADFQKYIVLKTWDRFTIPLPFSRAKLLIGKEIYVKEEDSIEQKTMEVQEELLRVSSLSKSFRSILEKTQS